MREFMKVRNLILPLVVFAAFAGTSAGASGKPDGCAYIEGQLINQRTIANRTNHPELKPYCACGLIIDFDCRHNIISCEPVETLRKIYPQYDFPAERKQDAEYRQIMKNICAGQNGTNNNSSDVAPKPAAPAPSKANCYIFERFTQLSKQYPELEPLCVCGTVKQIDCRNKDKPIINCEVYNTSLNVEEIKKLNLPPVNLSASEENNILRNFCAKKEGTLVEPGADNVVTPSNNGSIKKDAPLLQVAKPDLPKIEPVKIEPSYSVADLEKMLKGQKEALKVAQKELQTAQGMPGTTDDERRVKAAAAASAQEKINQANSNIEILNQKISDKKAADKKDATKEKAKKDFASGLENAKKAYDKDIKNIKSDIEKAAKKDTKAGKGK
jgi:hypothetical protein